jgi:mono/diheme cytochrome c family protein
LVAWKIFVPTIGRPRAKPVYTPRSGCENGGVSLSKVLLLGVAGVGLAGCRSVPPPVPLESLNTQQTQGRVVFQTHCAACHYDRKSGSLHGPALIGIFKKQTLPSGAPANDERVTDTVLHGHGLMPGLGDTMERQDVDDLLAYLHSL